MSKDSVSRNQLRWMARRGMLELDLLLNRFIEDAFDQLTEEEVAVFVALTLEEDQTLHSWFFTDAVADSEPFSEMVQKIKRCQTSS